MNRAVYDTQLRQAEQPASMKEAELLLSRHVEAFSLSPASDGAEGVDVPDLNGLLHRLYLRCCVTSDACDFTPRQLQLMGKLIGLVLARRDSRLTYAREMAGALMDALLDFYCRSAVSAANEPHRAALLAELGAGAAGTLSELNSTVGAGDRAGELVGHAAAALAGHQTPLLGPADRLHCLTFLSKLIGQPHGEVADEQLHAATCGLVDLLRLPARSLHSGLAGRDQSVSEIDASPVQHADLLTCAHLYQQWTPDLELSHLAFAALKRWLEALVARQRDSVERTGVVIKSELHCLLWKLLDQCERKPADAKDEPLLASLLAEAVDLARLLCQCEPAMTAKYFARLEAMSNQLLLGNAATPAQSPVLHVKLANFFLEHHAVVGKDAKQLLTPLYTSQLAEQVGSLEFCSELVLFTVNNCDRLCHELGITVAHFPNLLKILARWPRTFQREFADTLVAACAAPTNCVELFHSLLDLPCLSALYQHNRLQAVGVHSIGQLPARVQPYALYLTRESAGSGDTVDKLEIVHEFLANQRGCQLVEAAYQAADELLAALIDLLVEFGDDQCVNSFLPVVIDRSLVLYGTKRHVDATVARLAEFLVRIVDRCPHSVLDYVEEATEFVGQWKRSLVVMPMYVNVVWAFGEACRRGGETPDSRQRVQLVTKLYEALEAVAYEMLTDRIDWHLVPAKFWCCLATSLAKVASSAQDFLPRCKLVLVKVRSFVEDCRPDRPVSICETRCLMTRLNELLTLLQQPAMGPHILSPDWPTMDNYEAHANPQSAASIVQLISRLSAS